MPDSHTLRSLSEQLSQHIDTCEAQGIANADKLDAIAARIANIEQLPMKAVKYVAGIVATAAITLMVQNVALHNETNRKATQAAQAASAAASTAATSQAVITTKLDHLEAP